MNASAEDLIWTTYVRPVLNNPRLPYIHLQASVRWQKNILDATEKAWEYGAHDRKDYPMIATFATLDHFVIGCGSLFA